MPSMAARSRRSPAACTAMPMSVLVNQSETPIRQADGDDDGDEVVEVNTTGAMCQEKCQGKLHHRARDRRLTPDARDQQAHDDEELGQADGGDGEDQAGRAPEAPHDEDLHHGREQHGRDQPGGEAQEVVDAREAR